MVVKGGGHGCGYGAASRPHAPSALPARCVARAPGPSTRRRTDQHSGTGSQKYSAPVSGPTSVSAPSPLSITGPAIRAASRRQAKSNWSSNGPRRDVVTDAPLANSAA
jgi:hypothetical protein